MQSVTSLFGDIYADQSKRQVWDALWNGESIGRIAVAVLPNEQRVARVKERVAIELREVAQRAAGWTEHWDGWITHQLYCFLAANDLENDLYPALSVPGSVHSDSQGIADIFGARLELQSDGYTFAHPLTPDPAAIDDICPKPIHESSFWGAVEWIRYAREATGGVLESGFPVMTGPIDTANYLLGTTTLLEWVYTQPETLHRLLEKITGVIIAMVSAIKEAAGGKVNSHHFVCTRGGFDFCSEVRSLISLDMYEEFEAPCLRRVGEVLGPYGIHSCGNFERTIPSALADPNLRVMNGQIKENDLANLCEMVAGKLTLSIGPSVNVHDCYTWPDTESFFRHVIETVPDSQPFEISVGEDDYELWKQLCRMDN